MPPGPAPRRAEAEPEPVLPPSKILFNKYEIGRLLGCGAFAKVYHARNLRTGASVAVKCISKLRIVKTNLAANIQREASIMRRLRHPHVVCLHEVLATRSKIYFVMEFLKGGELFARVSNKGRLPEDISRSFFQQLISAVAFCHSRGIFHRDLKPENLLLDEFGRIKVSDFGLSAMAEVQVRPDGLLHTLCGTPAYVAPEVLIRKGYDGAKVDLWSCGVILFVLNAGYLPFSDSNLMNMYRKIYRGEYRIPRWMSPELKQLISRLLDTNPVTRITVEGIISDPWFKKGLEEEKMRAMISFDTNVEERMREAEQDVEPDRELNAFDIISSSSGFNLSGLFDGKVERAERARFVSSEPTDSILDKVEEVGRRENLVVRRRKGKVGRGRVAVEGQNGNLVAWVEVYKLSPGMVMVEVEKGETEEERWSSEFWRERLGPASEPSTPSAPMAGIGFSVGSASAPVSPMSSEPGSSSAFRVGTRLCELLEPVNPLAVE